MSGQWRGGQIDHGTLHIAHQVDHAKHRVVLGVDGREIPGNLGAHPQQPLQIPGVEVLHGSSHAHRAGVVLIEHHHLLGHVALGVLHLGHHHVVAALEVRNWPLHYRASPFIKHPLGRRLAAHLPKVRIGVGLRQSNQRLGDYVLLAAHNQLLALRCDVRQNIHHLARGTGAALGFLALHREALAGAHAALFVLAHQRDVVLVHAGPAIHNVLIFQAIAHVQLARLVDDGVHILCHRLQLPALRRVEFGEIVVCRLVGHARAAILQARLARVALGNHRVGLLGVAGVQVFLHILHAQSHQAHLVHQWLEFAGAKVLHPLGCALVEQLFFQVGVDAIGNLPGRLGDGLNYPLEIDVLVLQLVDDVIETSLHRGIPCGLRAGGGAGSAETNVGVSGVEVSVVAGGLM